jgi:putative transposase
MESQGQLSVVRMCGLVQLSRASFYRRWEAQQPRLEEAELREAIQQDWIAKRPNGYRSVTQRLRRQGWVVNAKRVQRLMREDNLLGLGKRKFVVTTDSDHDFLVYPNLAKQLVLTAMNQLWVADITYVRLQEEFVYLAVVLDAFSRRVVGWALRRTLGREVALAAWEQALANRQPGPGLVHHSDRGSQYASNEYVARLEKIGVLMSMSHAGRPWENGKCERFIGTLKREQLDGRRYRGLEELQQDLETFLETVYNRERLHSALGYRTPEEFEQQQAAPTAIPAGWSPAGVSFRRHEEIYSDVSEGGRNRGSHLASPDSSE